MKSIFVALLNFWNNLLHTEPISTVADCLYWLLVCLVGCPLAAVVVFLRMIYQVITYFVGSNVDPRADKTQELAVFITGCDSGFGKELVAPLTARGFTVFCGCLHKTSFRQFKDDSLAIPIQLDITSDKSVADAYKTVSTWLAVGAGSRSKRQRRLHALVNNAGIIRVGLIDWASMADFTATMDVNFYGMIRCVKAFLPIFKKQAAAGTYLDARIINMTSIAGLNPNHECFAAYAASKHAADSLTDNLRLEMMPYHTRVCCINPSLHGTPLLNHFDDSLVKTWDGLPSEVQEEYGKDYLQAIRKLFSPIKHIAWRSKNVVDAMEHCIVSSHPPIRELVGMDAKYIFAPMRLLPAGMGLKMIRGIPAAMKQ